MRAARALRSSGSRVRGIADKDNNFCTTETPRHGGIKGKALAFLCDSVTPWWILLSDWHAAAFAQLHDLVEHTVRDFPFRGFGHLDYFALRNNGYGIAVGVEA